MGLRREVRGERKKMKEKGGGGGGNKEGNQGMAYRWQVSYIGMRR